MSSQNDYEERKVQFQQSIKQVRGLLGEHGNQPGWDLAWKQGLTPWETMLGVEVQPSLRWACEQDSNLSTLIPKHNGKVLIPGCGRGQDVVYFATQRGLNAIGIDISTTAVQRAQEYVLQRQEQAQGSEKDAISKHAQIIVADYLDPEAESGPHKNELLQGADLVYDYT
jgi:methyl halide transferase